MWKILFPCLTLLLLCLPSSLAQDSFPPCWASDLEPMEVSFGFYESQFSRLDEIETADDLAEFAESYLSFRERSWVIANRCAESIEFAWRSQRALGFGAAYKALAFGLRAKIGGDPAVLARYNPLRATQSDRYYPERFNQELEQIRRLAKSDERQYKLSPQDSALPACGGAELARLAEVLPDYRGLIDLAQTVNTVDALVELAEAHIAWRKSYASETVHQSADGTISASPRDGLAQLPACAEAAELFWLMQIASSDKVRSVALTTAGLYDHNNPYLSAYQESSERIGKLAAKIENAEAEPDAEIRQWTLCSEPLRAALNKRLPAYQDYVLERSSPETLEEMLAYMRADIAWRESLWSSLPKCADALELALTFSQFAGDLRALYAFWLAETPVEEIPYLGEIDAGEFAVETFGGGLVGGSIHREFPPRLPACSSEAIEQLSTVLAQYQIYRERMNNFGTMAAFFAVTESLSAWRENILSAMPKCDQAYEPALLLSQLADDYIALFGLTFAGFGRDSNPWYESFQRNTHELAELMAALPIDRGPQSLVWEFGGELDLCDLDEITTLGEILDEYLALLDAGGRLNSLQALESFGNSLVSWRREQWPRLPSCAEAFEIGLSIYRSAGDQILFDVPAIAESSVANIIGGQAPLSTRLGQIYSDLPRKWRGQHSGELESHRRHCAAAQTETIANALAGYRSFLAGAVDFNESPEAFRAYVDQRISWRSESAAGLPPCLITFALDSVLALDLAESFSESIPVLGTILSGSDFLQTIAAVMAGGETTTQAVPDYVNRLPACAEAELRGLQEQYRAHSHLIAEDTNLDSQPALFDYIEATLEWRDELWASLPLCAEALQLGVLIQQIAGDIAARSALDLHNLRGEQNPYIAQEIEGRAALSRLSEKIADLIASGARQDQTPSTSPLPRCTEAEIDILTGYTYGRSLFPAFEHRSIPALLRYIEELLSWRAETWAPLPACAEAFILGSLTSRQTSDFAAYTALDWTGIARKDNPYMPKIRHDALQLVELTELLRKFDHAGIDRFVRNYVAGS